MKLLPCMMLSLLIPAIIKGMWEAKKRRQRLTLRRKPSSNQGSVRRSQNQNKEGKEEEEQNAVTITTKPLNKTSEATNNKKDQVSF